MTKKRKLITSEEAVESSRQHTQPCSDCPFARTALNGWLGGTSIEEWLARAHSNTMINCHVVCNQQCAGVAIYRRNVLRLPAPPLLVLSADKVKVFATPLEFIEHHRASPVTKRKTS